MSRYEKPKKKLPQTRSAKIPAAKSKIPAGALKVPLGGYANARKEHMPRTGIDYVCQECGLTIKFQKIAYFQ